VNTVKEEDRKPVFGRAKMKGVKSSLATAGLIYLLTFLPGTAVARVHVSIGLGTTFGHHYPGFYRGCYPYYGWHGGYYGWPHGRRGSWLRHSHWRRPLCSSSIGFWIYDSWPIVIDPPVHVEAPKAAAHNSKPKHNAVLTERMRQRKSELLKALKIGDKENRIVAIRDLSPFSFDDKVRAALEEVLLSDPEPELRKQVAVSFGKTAHRDAVPALEIAKAKDSDRDVRQAAYRAIIMIQGY
jgi:hypothetical protein